MKRINLYSCTFSSCVSAVILKLVGIITWSWWIVLFPTFIAIFAAVLIVFLIINSSKKDK